MSDDLVNRLFYRVNNPSAWPEGFDQSGSNLFGEAANRIETLEALTRDLADCLEDMTKHYVEVRNDLYGFEAAEEIEVIAAGKLISKAKSQQEGETE